MPSKFMDNLDSGKIVLSKYLNGIRQETGSASCFLIWRCAEQVSRKALYWPFKYEAQTALFKNPVRAAQ